MCTVIKQEQGRGRRADNCDANGGIRQVNIFLMRADRVGKCADEAWNVSGQDRRSRRGPSAFEFARTSGAPGRGHGFARGLSMSQRCGGERDARSAVTRQLRGAIGAHE